MSCFVEPKKAKSTFRCLSFFVGSASRIRSQLFCFDKSPRRRSQPRLADKYFLPFHSRKSCILAPSFESYRQSKIVKPQCFSHRGLTILCSASRIRTYDQSINSRPLYQLSYRGMYLSEMYLKMETNPNMAIIAKSLNNAKSFPLFHFNKEW